ncbi:MAG TPA: AAA family ATPase [Terriglobales bacterium]
MRTETFRHGQRTNGGAQVPQREPLRVVDFGEFLSMTIPARQMILSPWLLSQSVTMLYGPRGQGKTNVALSIGHAVATGGEVLGWKAERPRKVLYVDGEMLGAPLQERLISIAAGAGKMPPNGMFGIITPDLQSRWMPNLGTLEGQAVLEEAIPEDTELLILDSLSSLLRVDASENDDQSWTPLADWALRQRVARRSVLFLHHANRRGEQRGTSKREDLLDVTLALRRPADYHPNKGARFEIHIEKSRALCPGFVSLEAELSSGADGGVTWLYKQLEQSLEERIRRMDADGMPKREIAEELHINRSRVYRVLARAKEGA